MRIRVAFKVSFFLILVNDLKCSAKNQRHILLKQISTTNRLCCVNCANKILLVFACWIIFKNKQTKQNQLRKKCA